MKKILSALVASVGVLGVASVAAAHSAWGTTPVDIDSFQSVANVQATVVPVATCPGTDGTYTLLSATGSGVNESSDPRMAGIFHVDAYLLDSPSSTLGISIDNWTITDPVTGKVKASGKGVATDFGPNPQAVAFGRLADGSTMVANAQITLPAPGTNTIRVEYGSLNTVTPDRGVILSGKNTCVRTLANAIFH
jgi:hypothetical protein